MLRVQAQHLAWASPLEIGSAEAAPATQNVAAKARAAGRHFVGMVVGMAF
jgi:hypothetical protein